MTFTVPWKGFPSGFEKESLVELKGPLTLKAPITTIVVCFCLLLVTLKVTSANSVDPDKTAPLGAVWSGSTLFACMQK